MAFTQPTIMLPTHVEAPISAAYPLCLCVQKAIDQIYFEHGVLTYCKPKILHKFGSTENADSGVATTVAQFQGAVVNETFSTTNDIDSFVSDDAGDTQHFILEGHYYDGSNNKIFHVQTVIATGLTPVLLSQPLCRANRYYLKNRLFGSEPSNVAGAIAFYTSAGTTVVSGVVQTDANVKLYGNAINQSRKCASSLSMYDFYNILNVKLNAGKSVGAAVKMTFDVSYRKEGGAWLPLGLEGELNTATSSTGYESALPYTGIIPNNSDFKLQVNSDAANAAASGFISGYLLTDVFDPNATLEPKLLARLRDSV